MNLTFEKGYDDYTDSVGWRKVYEEARRFSARLTRESAGTMDDEELLSAMEQLEELIRYYGYRQDLRSLEPIMAKMNMLLSLGRDRKLNRVEFTYFQLITHRMTALQLLADRKFRQAAESYSACLEIARICVQQLKSAALTDEQKLYVGFNCVECWREGASACDSAGMIPQTLEWTRELIPLLDWLDPLLLDAPGICDKIADLSLSMGGTMTQHGDSENGNLCFDRSIRLFNSLDVFYGSDFYRARGIWAGCSQGLQEFLMKGDPTRMLKFEQQAEQYLQERSGAEPRDKAIVLGCQGMISVQKSVVFQQSGQLKQAIQAGTQARKQLKQALNTLEANYQSLQGYNRSVVYAIAGRVYNSYVGAMESLGIQLYQNEQYAQAKEVLTETLTLLETSRDYQVPEAAAVMVRAEMCQYLALVYSEEGDLFQMDSYAAQGVDLAIPLAEQTGNPAVWDIAVVCCGLTSETSLIRKNKPRAKEYAEKGLNALQKLAALVPDHPRLSLRSNLETTLKKASRKFFW